MSIRRRRRPDPSALPTEPFAPDPARGRFLDARLHLLDRQIIDIDGDAVTTVDDIEFRGVDTDVGLDPAAAPPVIHRLLDGPALGTRIFGGRPPQSRLDGVLWTSVTDIDDVVRTAHRAEDLDLTWRERWLREHIIGRIPGGRHDPQ